MDLMDASKVNAVTQYAHDCGRRADDVRRLRTAGARVDSDHILSLLEEHLYHSSALASLLLTLEEQRELQASAPPAPPPVPWWRRIVRAVRAGWVAL